ncbi:MAG: acyl carrier protein [Lewinella sp.]|nr:acyl carrier protein [Lewinella sp.]
MNITTFIAQLTEEFDPSWETQTLTPATHFRGLDSWSSMQALVVLARINEEYGVLLTDADLGRCETIQDLFVLVKAYKAASIG